MVKNLHVIFLEKLDTLPIQKKFAGKEPGTLFGTLSRTEQKNYLCDMVGIGVYAFTEWRRTSSVIVPKIDSLLLIAQHFHVSIDYLIGNTDSPEDYTEQHIHNYTGLSYDAIARLHEWKKESDEKDDNFFHMQIMSSLEALNIILEDNYNEEMTEGLKWDVLHYIANYLVADEMVREQGKLYFDSGSEKNLELNEGDIVIKSNTSKPLVVDHFRVIERITNNNKKIGLHKDGNFNKRVVASIAEIYRSNSIICIEKLLSSIVKRRKK